MLLVFGLDLIDEKSKNKRSKRSGQRDGQKKYLPSSTYVSREKMTGLMPTNLEP
ncbi:MAG: hypothetical protein ACJAZX_000076 [Rickettsiales bacterium]|jgi:hypothetical protein